jgi:hypothetical protein
VRTALGFPFLVSQACNAIKSHRVFDTGGFHYFCITLASDHSLHPLPQGASRSSLPETRSFASATVRLRMTTYHLHCDEVPGRLSFWLTTSKHILPTGAPSRQEAGRRDSKVRPWESKRHRDCRPSHEGCNFYHHRHTRSRCCSGWLRCRSHRRARHGQGKD